MTNYCRRYPRLLIGAIAILPLVVAGPGQAARKPQAASPAIELESFLGSYLAGRVARGLNDSASAVEFYRKALEAAPRNRRILERVFLMEATEGNTKEIARHARQLVQLDPTHRLARLWLGAMAFRSGNYTIADRHFRAASSGPIGELTSALARSWTAAARGRSNSALKFTRPDRRADWARFYLSYHRALLADLLKQDRIAQKSFAALHDLDSRTPRITMAYAKYAAHRRNFRLADKVLKRNAESTTGQIHPSVVAVARQVAKRERTSRLIQTPREGLAEVFYGLGDALTTEGGVSLAVIYLQLSLYLRPDFEYALAGLANAYESTKRYERAIATYERIPRTSNLRLLVDIRRAANLDALNKVDEAKAVLTGLLADKAIGFEKPNGKSIHEPVQPAPPTAEQRRLIAAEVPGTTVSRRNVPVDAVRQLQQVLLVLGHDPGPDSGVFNARTHRALRAFQRDAGLRSDGIAGPATRRRLQDALDKARTDAGVDIASQSEIDRIDAPLSVASKVRVYDAIANLMRRHKRHQESVDYYTKVIALIPKPKRQDWRYWYGRGTSYERLKDWPSAERDLLRAMELNPDQPLILNYLGYSWVDQNKNLERGLELISRAVKLKPEDGYIVDSLGWAYYRLERYAEAVKKLERAVELRPADPILNDHLGDALWRVGRQREARFQWKLALTMKPEQDAIPKIKRKIVLGLPDAADAKSIGLPTPAATKTKAFEKRASRGDVPARP